MCMFAPPLTRRFEVYLAHESPTDIGIANKPRWVHWQAMLLSMQAHEENGLERSGVREGIGRGQARLVG